MISIDGSYGEGGGQVLRTSLTLSMLTGRSVQIQRIRAGRRKPGLAPQHLTAVRAAATVCAARVYGDEIGSQWLRFEPGNASQAGEYAFDVAKISGTGSAGSVGLVLQTILLPLALASGPSRITLRGGTHVPWSPPFPYLAEVFLPTLTRLGIHATIELREWGFYPAGGGEIVAQIAGKISKINPLHLTERGSMQRIWGTAAVSNLPSHIPQRMANRARNYLADNALRADVMAQRVRANGPGAGIFLVMEHTDDIRAGFTAYGRKGLPAERVAEAACEDLLTYYRSNAPVDMHLADQLILPLAMAEGASQFTTSRVTEHLRTNTWVVEQFKQAQFKSTDKTITIIPLNQHRGNGSGNDPETTVSSAMH